MGWENGTTTPPGIAKTDSNLSIYSVYPFMVEAFKKISDTGKTMKGWGNVKAGASYGGVSPRTFRDWLKKGLRHSRLPSGTILIKFEWIDQYLESFAEMPNRIDQLVNEALKELRG